MPSTFYLEVVTPERIFFGGNAQMVIVPGIDGSQGILPHHEAMVTTIGIGELKIKINNQWRTAAIANGFMEVMPDYVIILADSVEWPEEIDVKRAEAAKERARERLRQKQSRIEHLRTQAAVRRALTRLKVTKEIK
ncbi:MAG: F-type H+-transporting ATPase subunit epsilon [Petroclostridium sp.]|jgi:F-type H+-transporting ATPase subunit epsilon|uniref:F0F1 ATP synthase subunit epsilon n=1 Tax=Petroclostridium xylanilyticum TaxID=1792311 RepID=UPI000B98D6FA|nr:F0F1 ATP synthase subunit epsilon [Petroclostridium xylanilyticum]MBZ4646980.1 synthase epsilon chain [Clostridia bacterium]MDK2810263.1 F-type H+-transporting ATPase subunit epsilon [Petroclostridium sp.]